MSKVAGLGPASLKAASRFLGQLELSALMYDIQDEAGVLQAAGKIEPDLLDAAIHEHRDKHPYR